MATKILFRRGNAAAIPALSVAEPGWDIDTKTFRIGDGTTVPPRVPSTKATGVFDFASITEFRLPKLKIGQGTPGVPTLYFNETDTDTGLYSPGAGQVAITSDGTQRVLVNNSGMVVTGDIGMLTDGTKVDTVDVSNLNPNGVNGLMVKTGDSTYTFRSLIAGNGMANPADGDGDANPYGAGGDIVLAIATNPTIPGTGAMKVPGGSTAQRAGVAATDGHLRYNTQDELFEGYIDGQWRAMVDYMEIGKTIEVPTQFSTIQDAIDYYDSRSTRSNVFVKLEAGVHTVTETLVPGSRTGRVNIIGEPAVNINLHASNPVHAISGSAGAWSVTYNLAAAVPAGITTEHSVLINDLIGSGDIPFYEPSGSPNLQGINQLSGDLNTLIPRNAAQFDLTDVYSVNDYIMFGSSLIGGHIRLITSAAPAALGIAEPGYEAMGDKFMHRKLKRLTGVISSAGDLALSGSGTAFLTELNVGDRIYTYSGHMVTVTAISSNTAATLSHRATFSNLVGLRFVAASMHTGCWKVDAIDTINNRITVINTSRDTWPPPKYGILFGRITFMPTAIVFTNQTLAQVVEGEFLAFNNLTIRYTGTAHATQVNYGAAIQGGEAEFGTVGFNRCVVFVDEGSDFTFGHLSISAVNYSLSFGLGIHGGARAVGSRLFITGNLGDGAMCSSSHLTIGSKSVFSGNTKRGAVTQLGGGAYFGMHAAFECNGSEALRAHGAFAAMYSTLSHNNGVRVSGTIESMVWSLGATGEIGDNSFITYAGRSCVLAYSGSQITMSNTIVANSNAANTDYARGHGGIGAHHGSYIIGYGCRSLNNYAYGVAAHNQSGMLLHGSIIANTGFYIQQNNEMPIFSANGSFVHLAHGNAVAETAYGVTQDVYTAVQSGVNLWRSYGSGGYNTFNTSPPAGTVSNANAIVHVNG